MEKGEVAYSLSRAKMFAEEYPDEYNGRPFKHYPSLESAIAGYSETLEWWTKMIESLKALPVSA